MCLLCLIFSAMQAASSDDVDAFSDALPLGSFHLFFWGGVEPTDPKGRSSCLRSEYCGLVTQPN